MAEKDEKAEEEKDTELDLIAEQELLRLMRQFRVRYCNTFKGNLPLTVYYNNPFSFTLVRIYEFY